MALEELANFREKYPDYNDIDDATLAASLAAKFPKQYGDLPGKVEAARNGPATDMPDGKYAGPAFLQERAKEMNAPQPGPSFVDNFVQGLTTDEKPRGVGGAIGRSALPTAGAILAAPVGLGIMSVPAAGLGATGGEFVRQGIVQLAGNRLKSIGDVVRPALVEGVTNAAGEGSGKLIAKGGKMAFDALAPSLATIATKVPLKYTEKLVSGGLKGAKTVEQAGSDYGAATGMQGLKAAIDDTPAVWMGIAKDAQEKLAKGTITPQEALSGIQALNKVKQAAKFGKDEFAGTRAEQAKLGEDLATYLEKELPGFREANKDYAKAMGADKFKAWLPQNKDGSPDVARSLVGLGTGTLPFMSPRLVKAGVDVVREVAPPANYVMRRSVSPLRAALDGMSQPNSKEGRQ